MFSLFRRAVLAGALAAIATATVATGTVAQPAADPNRLFKDSTLVVRDRFSDEIVGKGPDLVFIPGLASSRVTWKATAERLRPHYRLHLIQVAGFAGEPARANATGAVLDPTAEALDAYLVEAKLTPATVIGHSLGGTMTLELALAHPTHFKKALIVDAWPAFYRTMTQGQYQPADKVEVMAGQVRASMARPVADTEASRAALMKQFAFYVTDLTLRGTIVDWSLASNRPTVGQAMYDDLTLDLSSKLASNSVPLTILYPDNISVGYPAGAADKIYQTIYADLPVKTLVPIPHALHFIMWENPLAFTAALDGFLAQK